MNRRSLLLRLIGALGLVFTGGVLFAGEVAAKDHDDEVVGAVYTMTNATDANRVVILERDEKGRLANAGSVVTGGKGSGGGLDPLASQSSLVLTDNHRWLLAVNAGSNDISVFAVGRKGLELVDNIPSGGTFPTTLAVAHDLVYVLNAGGTPNITGFTLNHRGHLAPIPGSTRTLDPGLYSQVGFDPRENVLIVTHRSAGRLLVYPVGEHGRPAAAPVVTASNGAGPFSFAFGGRDRLLVAEAGANAVSSYEVDDDATLDVISGSVANGQSATCWITTAGPRYAFTANPGSHAISSYRVEPHTGALTLLAGVAATANRPLDLGVSENRRFLYALDPASAGIDAFRVEPDGSLSSLGTTAAALPLFAQGIAVR